MALKMSRAAPSLVGGKVFASSNCQEGLKNFHELETEIAALIKVLKASNDAFQKMAENRTGIDLQRYHCDNAQFAFRL